MSNIRIEDIFGQLKHAALDPNVFEKIDERDLKKAPNFVSWVTSPAFLNTSVLPKQIQIATQLMAEWCSRCSKPGYLEKLFDQSLGNIKDNVVFLEHGVCPKCRATRYDLVAKKELRLYNELVGKLGQRCIPKGTLVFTPDGLAPIESLKPGDLTTTGLVTEAFDSGTPEMTEIITERGYSFKGATETHRVAALNSDFGIVYKIMKDVEVGDTLLLHSPGVWSTSRPQFQPFTPTDNARKVFTFPTEVTPELARLVGYLISDGYYCKCLGVVCSNIEVSEDVQRCFEAVFGHPPRLARSLVCKTPGMAVQDWAMSGSSALAWLAHIGLPPAKRRDKVIPDFILRSPKDIQGEFLAGLFGGDGNIAKEKHSGSVRVQYSSVSKKLIYQLRLMLLNFGIVTSCQKLVSPGFGKANRKAGAADEGEPISYFLTFKGSEAVRTFCENVRLVEPKKLKSLAQLTAGSNVFYSLPRGQTHVKLFPDKLGSKVYSQKISVGRLGDTPASFQELIRSGYHPVRVVSTRPAGPLPAADISVADSNCYIASGFLSHNSGKSKLVGLLSTYVLHRMLKIPNPLRYYNQPSGEILQATFSALNDESCKENLWEPTRGFIEGSPWFDNYHSFLKAEGKRLSIELYRPLVKSIFYSHKRLFIHYTGAKHSTMRGKTRFFGAADEIGWMVSDETKPSLQLMNADAIYTALSNSLATLRQASNSLWSPTEFDMPPILMANISSPSSVKDKISRLEKDAEVNPKILAVSAATWQCNPAYSYESLRSEFAHMALDVFMRDFGAEPPLESNPFLSEPKQVDRIATEPASPVGVQVKTLTDSFGDKQLSMEPIYLCPPDKKTPRLLALDLGWKKNAFAICLFSLGQDGAPRLDFGYSLSPKPGITLDLAQIFDNFTLSLVKHFNIRYAFFDRWQSLDQVSRLRSAGVDAGLHSLTYKEMESVRGLIQSQGVRLPRLAMPMSQYVECYKKNDPELLSDPIGVLGIQLLTVRDTGTKFLKPLVGDDDLFRAFCLGLVKLQTDAIKKEFEKTRVVATQATQNSGALGSLRLRSGGKLSAGGGSVTLDSGKAFATFRSRAKRS